MSGFVGVVAALNAEACCLYAQSALFPLISGIGPERARRASLRLVQDGAQALASWGIAAGLADGLRVGSLVLPRYVVSGQERITVDEHWRQRLLSRLVDLSPISSGAIAHTPIVLSIRAQKEALRVETEAVAADMESMAVAQVARQAGVPFVAIRAIADPFDLALPCCALNAVDGLGKSKVTKLLPELARSPFQVLPLIRLALAFHQAIQTLKCVSRCAGPLLMASSLDRLLPAPR
jgi:adenosylhomocysteine nucleosidase